MDKDTFRYNDKGWPILEVTFPKHSPTLEEIHTYIQTLGTYFARKEKLLLIINLSDSGWVPPQLRFEIGKWIMEHKVFVRKYIAGNAYVVKSQLLRLALQTFMSFEDINQVVGPVKVFSSLDQAKDWATQILSAKEN